VLQAELAVSTRRFKDLRHLAAEVVHMEGPQAKTGGMAGPHAGSKDGPASNLQKTAAHVTTEQDSDRQPPPESAQLLPRLLAAMQAQHSVWQRVKVAMLAHLSRRLRAQLADSRAAAVLASEKAAEREAATQRRLQDANRVRVWSCAESQPATQVSLHCEHACAAHDKDRMAALAAIILCSDVVSTNCVRRTRLRPCGTQMRC